MLDAEDKPPTETQYEIWVHLFEADETDEIGQDVVTISATTHVAALRTAILDTWKNKLEGRDADELVVKPTRAGAPLAPKTRLWKVLFELDANQERQVYVEVLPKAAEPKRKIFTFPEAFKLQSEQTYDTGHRHVAMEQAVDEAIDHIQENAPKVTTEEFRVPPTLIVSLARSGKTTLLKHIFNRLRSLKTWAPIFVTFNGDLFQRKGNDVDDFLRAVTTQLLSDEVKEEMNATFSRERLDAYLNTAKAPVVLLLDELNALGELSADMAHLLHEMFLDRKDRYLCFTSHWIMDLSRGMAIPSPRGKRVVRVPFTVDYAQIAGIVPGIRFATPMEVVLYGGLPGLIYSVKVGGFSPKLHFDAAIVEAVALDHLIPFVQQLRSGEQTPQLHRFAQYTYLDANQKVVWPLCYAAPFFQRAKLLEISVLINFANAAALKTVHTGLEWEYTVQVALCIIAFGRTFNPFTEGEARVFGDIRRCEPEFLLVELDESIETIQAAQARIDFEIARTPRTRTSILALAFPTFGSFPLFDGLIRFVELSPPPRVKFWRGVQMRLTRDLPEDHCPEDFQRAILIRGDPPTRPTAVNGWDHLNFAQMHEFLPYSLRGLLPREWVQGESKKQRTS